MQNRMKSSAVKRMNLGDVYRISVKLQKTLRSIVTEIKDSADDLTASSNKLIKMAQDTQESVNDVYHAVGEISDGARNQANETTDANDECSAYRRADRIYI